MSSGGTSDLLVKVAYFSSLAGASILFGFSFTLSKIRKSTPDTPDSILYEEGVALARKALMRGTIYSVGGFTLFAVGSYALFGRKLIDEFNSKAKKNQEQDLAYLSNLFNAPESALTGSVANSTSQTLTDTNKADQINQ